MRAPSARATTSCISASFMLLLLQTATSTSFLDLTTSLTLGERISFTARFLFRFHPIGSGAFPPPALPAASFLVDFFFQADAGLFPSAFDGGRFRLSRFLALSYFFPCSQLNA